MTFNLATAIEEFWIARMRGEFFPQAYVNRLSLDDAYRIQLALIDRRVAAGERHIGWKVGLTAKVIQEQFGFHEPLFGCILETQPTGRVFGATELIQPGFETELCIRLERGLEGQATLEQVRAAVDVVHPSFEIIETRGDPLKQTALVIADNAQQRQDGDHDHRQGDENAPRISCPSHRRQRGTGMHSDGGEQRAGEHD